MEACEFESIRKRIPITSKEDNATIPRYLSEINILPFRSVSVLN